MPVSDTVFLSISQITQVHKKEIFLSDIAQVYCANSYLENRCKAIKIRQIKGKTSSRFVGNVMDVVKKIEEINSSIQIQNLGETDFIVDYEPSMRIQIWRQWLKTVLVCGISFCGGAFAIMTFNNDANVTKVFGQIYEAVTGTVPQGPTILDMSYSVGLAGGIICFFNHFFQIQVTRDPTPIEVEMRLYEDDVNKTVIQNSGRKESGVDVG